MTSYDPCPLEYQTFMRTSMSGKLKEVKVEIDRRKEKENQVPGPGHYQMINTWLGKDKLKPGQVSYFGKLHKNMSSSVYHSRSP